MKRRSLPGLRRGLFLLGLALLGLAACRVVDEFKDRDYTYVAIVSGEVLNLENRKSGTDFRYNYVDSDGSGDSLTRYTSMSFLQNGRTFGLGVQGLRLRVTGAGADSALYRALAVGSYAYATDSTAGAELTYVDDRGRAYSSLRGPQGSESYFEVQEKRFMGGTRRFEPGAEVRVRFQGYLYGPQNQRIFIAQGEAYGMWK
jgi:hypothetical protein